MTPVPCGAMLSNPRARISALAISLAISLVVLAVVVLDTKDAETGPETVFVRGIPHVDYKGSIGVQENPANVGGWGQSDDGDLIAAADWLVEHQGLDGAWRYGFDYVVTARMELQQGWASAIAQGRALSALSAAHQTSPRGEYVTAMRRAVEFLEIQVEDGGVRTELSGGLWFEEYPTEPGSYVLNGFLYLLEGLWESKGFVPQAEAIYQEARETVEKHLSRWDAGGVVAYDLLHEAVGGHPWIDRSYDAVHERLLRELLEHQRSGEISAWLDRWFGG